MEAFCSWRNAKNCLWFSFFYPFLSYGIVVWGATHERYLKPVFISQKEQWEQLPLVVQLLIPLPCFWTFKYLSLKIYIVFPFFFAYECVNNIAPIHFRDYLTQISEFHQYNTRSASHGDLFLVRKNTVQYGLRLICFNGVKPWNTILSDIRNSLSVHVENFFLGGGSGKPCLLGVAWQLWKNGNFGRVGDKSLFKMYKKAGVGREGDIW